MAETPSSTLLGVQRVVISCDTVTGLSESERAALCEQLVKKADAVTNLPVALASTADLDPTNLARQSEQLLLRVTASATPVDKSRKTIALTVTPVRAAVAVAQRPASASTVSLLKVQDDWILQGPVGAFNELLGTGPRKLHKPIRSEI